MSALDYSAYGGGKYVYMPKVGESLEVKIKEIRECRVGLDKFHFQKKIKVTLPDGKIVDTTESMGFHIEAELDDGKILSITSWASFLECIVKKRPEFPKGVQDGDHVRFEHIAKGEWKVTKL
jgi:hypothetical protein